MNKMGKLRPHCGCTFCYVAFRFSWLNWLETSNVYFDFGFLNFAKCCDFYHWFWILILSILHAVVWHYHYHLLLAIILFWFFFLLCRFLYARILALKFNCSRFSVSIWFWLFSHQIAVLCFLMYRHIKYTHIHTQTPTHRGKEIQNERQKISRCSNTNNNISSSNSNSNIPHGYRVYLCSHTITLLDFR